MPDVPKEQVALSPVKETTGSKLPPLNDEPVLNPVVLTEAQKREPVREEALDKAQKQLKEGDRAGAYLTLYKETGSEQILIQAQITTYTGLWGSGALAGNNAAKDSAGDRYNLDLDKFSSDIAQSTIDGIRADIKKGGTGRLTDSQFKSLDRGVWKDKNMGELFPGNVQFTDFWNHKPGDRGSALFSKASLNMMTVALKALTPDLVGQSVNKTLAAHMFGLPTDGSQAALEVGKRPAEFEGNPRYKIHGGEKDRFLTVVDKETGHVEAFWDKKPKIGGVRVPQLPNKPLHRDSNAYARRYELFKKLGANRHALPESTATQNNFIKDNSGRAWLLA